MSNPEHDDLDERIDALHEKAGEHLEACLFRAAYRVYGELKRIGKAEQRVIPYLNAVFHQMDLAQSLLEPRVTRENAIELIALLEDEERARLLQPDFPVPEYEAEATWMTACAYENLAEATGMLEGYNSKGMHQCITDGIEVCRRTGKLACVNCFREYAAQVFVAADDLDMALHHARVIAGNQGPYPDRGDRRHLGARNEGWLMLLEGRLDAAETSLEHSVSLCDGERVSIPLSSRLHTLIELETVRLLAGKQDPAGHTATVGAGAGASAGGATGSRLPEGERPDLELRWAYADAIRACLGGGHAQAIALLTDWDRRLTERHCLHDWFETRLRLLAVHRLAGHNDKVAALARPLEQRARKADDWLTVRRLARLLDPAETPSPLALLAPLNGGPFASAAKRAAVPSDIDPASEPTENAFQEDAAGRVGKAPAEPSLPSSAEQEAESTPLAEAFGELVERLEAAEDDPERDAVLEDVLALPPEEVTNPVDACQLLNFIRYLVGDGSRGEEIWAWSERVAQPLVQHPVALSLLGVLGDTLRSTPAEGMRELLPKERVEKLLRQALDLDPRDPGTYARAGAYFLSEANFGEAERCLARGFRLERSNSFLALRLAEVYNQTERPRDALAVLDLCVREGCDDPEVVWEAALGAFRLNQYDVMLTYLDRFEDMTEADAWACYYRATALLELGRPDEAVTALDEAERRDADKLFPVNILRACAFAALGQPERYRELLEDTLEVRLADIDYLTVAGLNNLFGRLWKASPCLGEDDPLREVLRLRVLTTGLAPDELFDEVRDRGTEARGINYYRCLVRQPLDEDWASSEGCLSEQQNWTAYHIVWGVLAADEDEARLRVLEWQEECYPIAAEVEEIEQEADGFTDKPGVVWQGTRWGEEPDDEDEEEEVNEEE
jgi:tetratricopeptide (TPR) repeat protein